MKKRLFLAIDMPAEIQAVVSEFFGAHENLRLRYLAGKNLHITLLPPWRDDDVGKIVSDIRKRIPTGREITINFDHVSFGPSTLAPRLIWAEGGAPRSLITLKEELEEVLGFKPEPSRFRMHLTLARFRPEEFAQFDVKELNERVDWQFKTKTFVLMESHLLPDSADYEVLQRFPI
ncbi:MAG: RNA 2',3'-cyclic phosphodiesterase [Candidatus Liptonbacteria bacterium]